MKSRMFADRRKDVRMENGDAEDDEDEEVVRGFEGVEIGMS